MIRKTIFFLSIMFVAVSCQVTKQQASLVTKNTNNLQAIFDKDITMFFNFFNEEDWENMIGMMSPEIFEIASKEQMITGFDQMVKRGMGMRISTVKIYHISDPFFVDNKEFRRLDYKAKMTIKISGSMLNSIELFEKNFKDSFGEVNVQYDEKSTSFLINSDKSLIAISKKEALSWKYLEFNESQPQMLKTLFSDAVYQNFKSK